MWYHLKITTNTDFTSSTGGGDKGSRWPLHFTVGPTWILLYWQVWGLILGDISISTELGQGPESLHLNLIDHFTYVILSGWSANRSNFFTLTLGALFRHSEGISSIQLVNMSKFRFCKLSLHGYSDKWYPWNSKHRFIHCISTFVFIASF